MHPKLYSKGNKSKKLDLFSKGLQATVHCQQGVRGLEKTKKIS